MAIDISRVCMGSLVAFLSLGGLPVSAAERVSVTLQGDQVQNYSRLLEQAVAVGNSAIATTFATHPAADPIELTILLSRNGQILPILMAEVSRTDWQQQPDVQNWARYSNSVRILLGYAPPIQVAVRPPVRRPIIENSDRIDELD